MVCLVVLVLNQSVVSVGVVVLVGSVGLIRLVWFGGFD